MIVTTTNSIEGYKVNAYLGIATGQTIIGANILKDLLASLTDVFGGRASAYEKTLIKARDEALAEMESEAQAMGADAILGVDIDYEVLGAQNGMLMVSVNGTAVRLEGTPPRAPRAEDLV